MARLKATQKREQGGNSVGTFVAEWPPGPRLKMFSLCLTGTAGKKSSGTKPRLSREKKNLGTLGLCSGELLFCVQELVKRNLLSLTVCLFLNSMGYLGVLCTLVRTNM